MRLGILVGLVLLAAAASCGGDTSGGPSSHTSGDTSGEPSSHTSGTNSAATPASLPACALFDPADASYQGCGAARAYVSCTAANGGGAACLSNDPTQCPGAAMASPGCSSNGGCASGFTCEDVCNPNEFGVSCGGIGPQGGPPVPSTCRALAPTPAGVIFACCRCGP
jgi:hypothetical protein